MFRYVAIVLFLFITLGAKTQTIPSFGPEIPVTINGYSMDAMEPFISPDGNALFFNSLNNGVNTSLFYAAKSNDSTFNLVGLMPAVNETVTPYLNGVASIDSLNNFFWVSTRNYPADFDNLHRVTFGTSSASNFARVHGNIYIYSPGWIIMDAAISHDGNYLYYSNAYFNNCSGGLPCFARLNVAQKVNDSTFAKLSNSNPLLAAVNDTMNYIIYAPNITKDGLELYYTRLLIGTTTTEVMVTVRSNTNSAFGPPSLIYASSSLAPEGPTITTDKTRLYYHKKLGSQYKLVLRYRNSSTSVKENNLEERFNLFPNPVKEKLSISNAHLIQTLVVYDQLGLKKMSSAGLNNSVLDISDLSRGIYFLELKTEDNRFFFKKFIKE